MNRKIKELCRSLPQPSKIQSPLDNVATNIFLATRYREYIQSSSQPERRYGIAVDASMLKHNNEFIDDFAKRFGPNEQYLINKILFSPYDLIYIVGGIGVGKTTFSHFLITSVLKELHHLEGQEKSRCPCPIYLDFLDWGHETFSNKSPEETQETFANILCDRIEHELATKKFLTLEEEVGTAWEIILSSESQSYQKNAAISYITARLREEEAGSNELRDNFLETIEKRKRIRREVTSGKNLRRFYLAALLKYIKANFYHNHPGCFLLVVDNIDLEPVIVQQSVKMILKPFVRSSGIKTVVTARQTTFQQTLYDDGLSEIIDQIAYCGPSSVDIVLGRMDEFVANHKSYGEFYAPDELPVLVEGIRQLREYINRDWFKSFLLSLSGRSVRKALLLAQNLIYNSVYDPYKLGSVGLTGSGVGQRSIMRALLVGSNITYEWTSSGLIENIFQVQDFPAGSYFIKLRILRAVLNKGDYGLKIKNLNYVLNAFGYSLDLVLDAVNELMQKPKRLVWSDAVRQFDSMEDITRHGNAHLFISSIGHGYATHLFKLVAYIQEVMLDTYVKSSDFGSGWDYAKMEDRLKLVTRFCQTLLQSDAAEVEKFIESNGRDEYARVFGRTELLSKEILESAQHYVAGLFKFMIERGGKADPLFEEFKEEQLGFYKDRLITASLLEERLFGH